MYLPCVSSPGPLRTQAEAKLRVPTPRAHMRFNVTITISAVTGFWKIAIVRISRSRAGELRFAVATKTNPDSRRWPFVGSIAWQM